MIVSLVVSKKLWERCREGKGECVPQKTINRCFEKRTIDLLFIKN